MSYERKTLRKSGYYVAGRCNGFQFLMLNAETGAMRLSTCPHNASIFTSRARAVELCDQVNRDLPEAPFDVIPTVTEEPRVIVG